MELGLFDVVAEACRGMIPAALGPVGVRPRPYGVKVWFGGTEPGREHYEAQVVSSRHVPGADHLGIEVGFHSEHPKTADNDAVLAPLAAAEKRWRRALGPDPEVGGFLGRADTWRRISETWADPDLSDPDLAVELAARLCDYVEALEPLRR